jgi:hypothetical protein
MGCFWNSPPDQESMDACIQTIGVRFLQGKSLLEVLWQKTKLADEVWFDTPNTSGVAVHKELDDRAARGDFVLDEQRNASRGQIVVQYHHVCIACDTAHLQLSSQIWIVNCWRKEQEYVPWSSAATFHTVKEDRRSARSL